MSLPDKSDVEPCGFCAGAGSATTIDNFLLLILRTGDDASWLGASSRNMLAHAIAGTRPAKNEWAQPFDGWDLGRCMVMRDVAPPELHEAMDKMINVWVRKMNKDKRENGSPYYDVKDARAMQAKRTPEVRAHLERLTSTPASSRKEAQS